MKHFLKVSSALFFILVFTVGCGSDRIINNKETLQNITEYAPTPSQEETSAPTEEETPTPSPDDKIINEIKSNLDILAKTDPEDYLSKTGTIKNAVFEIIVALGKDALPYLEVIADRECKDISWYPDVEFEQRIWAVYAVYAIKPEVYDLFFPSPDDKYTVKLPVNSFVSFFNHGRSFYDIQVIENDTNKIVFKTDMGKVFSLCGIIDPLVNWSADSRFAIVDCCGLRSGDAMALDMQTKSDICLPGAKEIMQHIFPGEDFNAVVPVPRVWFEFKNWEPNKSVKIEFDYCCLEDDDGLSGWYIYNLTEKSIIQLEYAFD